MPTVAGDEAPQQPGTPEPPGIPPQPPPDPRAPRPYEDPPRPIPIPRPDEPPIVDDPPPRRNGEGFTGATYISPAHDQFPTCRRERVPRCRPPAPLAPKSGSQLTL